jgi:hypothetical protein
MAAGTTCMWPKSPAMTVLAALRAVVEDRPPMPVYKRVTQTR